MNGSGEKDRTEKDEKREEVENERARIKGKKGDWESEEKMEKMFKNERRTKARRKKSKRRKQRRERERSERERKKRGEAHRGRGAAGGAKDAFWSCWRLFGFVPVLFAFSVAFFACVF